MENKQKAIEKAYGEHWESVKDYVDEDGNLDKRLFTSASGIKYSDFDKILFEHFTNFTCRPKSLQGIETNNGWIKIDENFNWGKNNEYLIFWDSEKKESIVSLKYALCEYQDSDYKKRFTHYQPIIKPKKPIY